MSDKSADWKRQHANDASASISHPLVEDVIAELLTNLGLPHGGLPAYGVRKVALYAAQVARAQALGFDPELLRLTEDEGNKAQMALAAELVWRGVPVHLIEPGAAS